MPLPEGYLPRKGDELLIRVRARRDTDKLDDPIMGAFEIVGREHNVFYLPIDQIHSLYCRVWNVGEKVVTLNRGNGIVLAVNEDVVWVKLESGTTDIFGANYLHPHVGTVSEPAFPPCGGAIGSQSIVGDDDPIAVRDEAANR